MLSSLDYGKENGTGEILATILRPGNKTSKNAKDHIAAHDEALAQLPDTRHDEHGNLVAKGHGAPKALGPLASSCTS